MADYTKQDIFDLITEYLEQYGSALGSGAVRELSQSELTDETLRILTIPSMLPSTEEWVQTSLHNMMQPITNAVSDLNTLKSQTIQAKDNANAAAARVEDAVDDAEEATEHAENVNATLVGMTVTVTDRNGQSRSVNIGFEIDPRHVYTSKNAMKADAANVAAGQFCMIATTDPTDPDNATLWSRNNQPSTVAEPYTFLSDLDQASTSAWADWMNNQKPLIIAATDAANAAAILANAKAVVAQTAADNANASRLAIEQNEQTRQTNEQNRVSAETQRQSDWTAFFSDSLATGCRYLWNAFWTNINTLWDGFWGTSADDPNGVRKQWNNLRTDSVQATNSANAAATNANEKASLANTAATNADNSRAAIEQNEQTRQQNEQGRVSAESQRVTDWTNFFSDTLATGCRKLWNDFWSNINSLWTGFWGTSAEDPNGVRKQWSTLRGDAIQATSNANDAATNANEKAALANEKATLANEKAGLANEKAALADTKATFANTEGNRAKAYNDHPWEIRDDGYIYVWDETTQAMKKTNKCIIDFEDLTEEQMEEIISHVAIVTASIETCEAIIDELV